LRRMRRHRPLRRRLCALLLHGRGEGGE
jgi:hypothetical protein